MKIIKVYPDGDKSLYKILIKSKNSDLLNEAICGGLGSCGKCKIKFLNEAPKPSIKEKQLLSKKEIQNKIRLACHCFIKKPYKIIQSKTKNNYFALSEFANLETTKSKSKKSIKKQNLGVAVDLGTTTIALALVNITEKKIIAKESIKNSQSQYGADVLLRGQKSCEGKNKELEKLILEDIFFTIIKLAKSTNTKIKSIKKIVISGNTIMLHLLLNLPTCKLVQSPFEPYALDYKKQSTKKLIKSINFTQKEKLKNLKAKIIALPCVNAFVGSDVLTALQSYILPKNKSPLLYLDLGTNAEIIIVEENRIWSTTTAAGPAFEGANISRGCGSIAGAVSKVYLEENKIKYDQIPPSTKNEIPGICGTGLIDVLAIGLSENLILPEGNLAPICETTGIIIDESKNLSVSGKDIRELQLAIAAVKTGIEMLLEKANLKANQIKKLYVSGGFGTYLNVENAIKIGLFPGFEKNQIKALGNASLGACVDFLLNKGQIKKAKTTRQKIKHLDLANEKSFNQKFIKNLNFYF